jgi:hypothetical protein
MNYGSFNAIVVVKMFLITWYMNIMFYLWGNQKKHRYDAGHWQTLSNKVGVFSKYLVDVYTRRQKTKLSLKSRLVIHIVQNILDEVI